MTDTAAERVARRLHDGQLDRLGAPYVEHLERVAARVASHGGDRVAQEAAWLHGAWRTGVRLDSLAASGVSRPAIGLAQRLRSRGAHELAREGRGRQARRLAVVLRADLEDGVRPEALAAYAAARRYSPLSSARDLLAKLGHPLPADLKGPPWPPAPPRAASGPVPPPKPRPQDAAAALALVESDDPRAVEAGLYHLDVVAKIPPPFETLARIRHRTGAEWQGARWSASRALLDSGDPRRWEVLVTSSAVTGDPLALGSVRFNLEAPRSLAPQVIRLLELGRSRVAWEAALVCADWDLRETIPLLEGYARDPLGSHFLANVSIGALERFERREPGLGLSGILGAAGHPDPSVRGNVVSTLARVADTGTVTTAALRLADDVHPFLRRQAVRQLARSGDARAVPALLRGAEGGPAAPDALRGLARLADPRAVDSLADLFVRTRDRRLRDLAGRAIVASAPRGTELRGMTIWSPFVDVHLLRATAWVLGRVGTPTASRALRHGLGMADAVLRARCADALGRLGDPAGAEPLRAALGDPDRRVRANAATALGRLGVPGAAAWLVPSADDADRTVRDAAAAARRRLGTG